MLGSGRSEYTKAGLIAGIVISVIIAALFIIWGRLESAEYQREADYKTAEYSAYTYEKVGQSCLRLSSPDKVECLAQARHERRAYERNEQDLVAQRQSALWAYIMGAAAVIGMGLSVIGVFLVWTTFNETRRANEIASRVSAADLRPYLFVDKVTLDGLDDIGEVDEHGGFDRNGPAIGKVTIYFRNFGKVPARNIVLFKKSYLAKLHAGRFWRPRFDHIRMLVCAPGHERKAFARFVLTGAERADFNKNTLEFILRLRFTYEDDAGNSYKESAAFVLDAEDPANFFLLGEVDVAGARKSWGQFQLDLAREIEERA
jgi:hypothetical protein